MNNENDGRAGAPTDEMDLSTEALAVRVRVAQSAIAAADDLTALEELRIQTLGRKGWLTGALRRLGTLPDGERRSMGQRLNEARRELETGLTERADVLRGEALEARLLRERIDVTLPAQPRSAGRLHPLTRARRDIEEIFLRMGYSVVSGPEMEEERLNFELLNIPPDHPARDMQDSFYPADLDGFVLRTHTSPVQIRAMLAAGGRTPLRVIAPGRAYRRDEEDATHVSAFHQVEALAIDTDLSLADLKGELTLFARAFFGAATEIRLRPSYFPFTEPSAELDVTCPVCAGGGCRVCKESGFIELLGAGMVHPAVLRNGGYDPERVQGFAFGLGLERAAMLRLGVEDARLFAQGDLDFLRGQGALTGWPASVLPPAATPRPVRFDDGAEGSPAQAVSARSDHEAGRIGTREGGEES